MKKMILRIDSSMRKQGSISRLLTDNLIDCITKNEKVHIKYRDLADGIPVINEQWINANFTPTEERTPEQRAALTQSDALIAELKEATDIVIGLPIYNFSVPAAFKAWIDLVARTHLTFRYTDNGPVGMLENKKAYVIITSGGTMMGSGIDFASKYTSHVLGFIGITDVQFINSSGLGLNEQEILSDANNQILSL